MAKLRLSINSTSVLGVYGIVDIVFNGTTLVSAKQLSETVENLEYDIASIDNTSNTLKISLLNDQAHDSNSDGDFNDAEDQVLRAQVSNLTYSSDGSNYITLLPQAATSHTIAGTVVIMTENILQFGSYGLDNELIFNNDGIVYNDYCTGVMGKVLENGNYLNLINGKTYGPDGNEVIAP